MIDIKLRKQNKKIVGFEVSGHSGYAESGADIVCASVSSGVWITLNAMERAGIECMLCQDEGYVKCALPELSIEQRKTADILLQSFDDFITSLAEQYKSFISKTEVL